MTEAVDIAYRLIREGILSGTYPQGAHITAQHLAEVSGFSRTPVREAMRRLHAEGLLKVIPNRGAFVNRWNENQIEQLYELRVLLEGFAAQEAARRATPDQIAALSRLAEEMNGLVHQPNVDFDAVTRVNGEFHKAVLEISDNTRLADILNAIVDVPLVMNTFRRYTAKELQRSAAQHQELVAAFEAGDPAWAQSIMTVHIRSARHTLTRTLGKATRGDAAAREGGSYTEGEPAERRRRKARHQSARNAIDTSET